MVFLTLKKLLSMFLRLNLSSLPATDPGSGRPWLHGSGSIVVGAFTGGGSLTVREVDGTPSGVAGTLVFPNGTVSLVGGVATITGLQGPQGLQGPPGLQGLAGPNSVSNTTATTLSGILLGNGSTVSTVTIGANLTLINGVLSATGGTTDASQLTTGTLADARLSPNVTLLSNTTSGTGAIVLATSPTLTTPILGVAACTSIAIGAGVSIVRNATGPAAQIQAAGGLRVTTDGTTLANVNCSRVFGTNLIIGSANTSLLFNVNSTAENDPVSIKSDGNIGLRAASNLGWTAAAFSNTTADTTLSRAASGVLQIGSGGTSNASGSLNLTNLTASGWIDAAHRPFTVAGLPLASANSGKTFRVTDSTLAMTPTNYGSTPAGGGSNNARVYSTGSAWIIA